MNNEEIKKANRKAMPKFILVLVLCLVLGCLIGYMSAKFGLSKLSSGIKNLGKIFGLYVSPWLLLASAVFLPIISTVILKNAKKALSSWDGENEAISDAAEAKISIIIWISNTALIISYFLIAACYSQGSSALDGIITTVPFIFGILSFLCVMIEAIIIQQKCVDIAKMTNPEKTVSAYDLKFQKKWMDSCDEAEKLLIGKCAYKAFNATNTACVSLAVILAVCALVFKTGFLPSLAVCIIWMVNQFSYYKEATKYSKVGSRIS